MSIHSANSRVRLGLMVAVAGFGVLVTALSLRQMARNFHARDHFTIWGWQERVYWSTTFTSCFAAVIAGPWIWWRARGPIGAWVTIAALLMSAWFGVEYWPNRAGFWFYWSRRA